MNRIVKFRALIKETGEMIPVDDIQFFNRAEEEFEGIKMVPREVQPVLINTKTVWRSLDEVELMQFTGMFDKNGKEIYEGDILRYVKRWTVGLGKNKGQERTENHYYEVYFDRGQWRMKRGELVAALFGKTDNHEVVGCVYQNPDLLTV